MLQTHSLISEIQPVTVLKALLKSKQTHGSVVYTTTTAAAAAAHEAEIER